MSAWEAAAKNSVALKQKVFPDIFIRKLATAMKMCYSVLIRNGGICMKLYQILSAAVFALLTAVCGCVCACALSINGPVTANENNATVWIFAVVIGILAAGGIAYFIISNKKK